MVQFVYALVMGMDQDPVKGMVQFGNAMMFDMGLCVRDRSRLTLGVGHDGYPARIFTA